MANGNGTQHQLLFRVPNTTYGRAFIEWSKSFLNTDSYRLKVRGRDGVPLKDAAPLLLQGSLLMSCSGLFSF